MPSLFTTTYNSPLGELIIGDYQDQLSVLDWKYRAKREQVDKRICDFLQTEFVEMQTALHREVMLQLDEYFNRRRVHFDVPLVLAGTSFQQSVWRQLMRIPYGQTITYLELSRQLGDEKAIRAVASANGANGISIIVPCHRVVGTNGELTGYAGGLRAKRMLLDLEGKVQQQVLFE